MNKLTKISDLSGIGVDFIMKAAFHYGEGGKLAGYDNKLKGKTVGMIFEKPSLRTKMAFEIAANSLGGNAVFFSGPEILASGNHQAGRESLKDIAKVMERMCDAIVIRTYEHQKVVTIADNVSIAVINALCDDHHPTQALADLMVMMQHNEHVKARSFFDKPSNCDWMPVKVAFVGDANNVSRSLAEICALKGIDFVMASPKGYNFDEEFQKSLKEVAEEQHCKVEFIEDPVAAVIGADFVYADTFTSMGFEDEHQQRLKIFADYQVNSELMSHAKPEAKFMHCLPAHRGEEVTDEVMDSPQSIVFDQAECRLHVAKALLFHLT